MTTTTPTSAARTARERARAEINREILDAGRRHLAVYGAPALSLRAIARDLGMVPSALYRYVASRDDLLTRLIIDAYSSLGAAAEAAEAKVARGDLAGRFAAVCGAVRSWALANPNEYALIYGSPVPGYHAPSERTVPPAMRVTTLLMRLLDDGSRGGLIRIYTDDAGGGILAAGYRADLEAVCRAFAPAVPAEILARGFLAWTLLFGAVTFELFGRLDQIVEDLDGYFDDQVRRAARLIGFDGA